MFFAVKLSDRVSWSAVMQNMNFAGKTLLNFPLSPTFHIDSSFNTGTRHLPDTHTFFFVSSDPKTDRIEN